MFNLRNRKAVVLVLFVLLVCFMLGATALAAGEADAPYESNMYGSFWSLVPPIIAIVLALITKEVYSSLFIGILAGALFYANF